MAPEVQEHKMAWAFYCILVLGLFENAEGSGHIDVHFLKYRANCHEDINHNRCDPLFTFCLSTPQRGRLYYTNCNYASTGESNDVFQDTNYIDFTHLTRIGGHVNPWSVHVEKFLGPSVMLVVNINDADIFRDDHLQTMGITLTETVWPDKEQSVWEDRVLSQNSYIIEFRIRLYCDPYYYSSTCAIYCKQENSNRGHYTCSSSGDKVCMPGWTGNQCTEDIDECFLGVCTRGECTNLPGDYTCTCPKNYVGKNCTHFINACHSHPCQNGGNCFAHASEDAYFCQCSQDFEGTNCESRKDACKSNPCLNNGICTNSSGSNYTCSCVDPFIGVNCEINGGAPEPASSPTETTTPQPAVSSSESMTSVKLSETEDANVQHLRHEESNESFPLYYIAVILAILLLIVIIFIAAFIWRRRGKATKSEPQSPVVAYTGNSLAFESGMYATVNRNNSEIDRMTRQLPPVPSNHIKDDAMKPTYATINENEGATGGSKANDSGLKKNTSNCQLKSAVPTLGALTRSENERAPTNHYADFKTLRDSQIMTYTPETENHKEEVPYDDLDEIAAQLQDGDIEPMEGSDAAFNYVIPDTPIVTVQTSPYDSPSNNSSYYMTPKAVLPSPLVPDKKYVDFTPSDDNTNNSAPPEISPYVNALDSDSSDEDILQEDVLQLRKAVENNMTRSSKS